MSERLVNILINAFPQMLIAGVKVTIPLTILSFAVSLVLGLMLAIVQVANVKVLNQISRFYVWVFRGTPLIVQLFIIFFGLPSLGVNIDAFPAAIMAFGLNLAAYNAEVFRASILAIPVGQYEAAYMVGLSYVQTMVKVILPQAFPIAFPSLFNNLISLLKDTSLAFSITVVEMFATAKQVATRTYEPFALYCETAVIYLVFSTALSSLQRWLEGRMVFKHKEKDRIKEKV